MGVNAIDVECPVCGAKPGERCHTLTGKANPVSHSKRKLAALESGHVREDVNQSPARDVREATEEK
jgi:hypothetical protein